MSFKPTSRGQTVDSKLNYKEVLRILLEDMDLMQKLVSLFCIQEKILSHLAAKCVSSIVLFQLQESNSFNSVWQQMCLNTFRRGCPCRELDGCLWSLTAVLKGVLKGTYNSKRELLEKLLIAFDPVLPDLYTGLLSQRGVGSATVAYPSDTYHIEVIQTTFTDLLEMLTAARVKLQTCTMSQRLLHLQASVLLQLADSPAHYSVKKKVLLLLKRSLLQKAGEDLCTAELQSSTQGDSHLIADMWILADSVLESVRSGWVQRISVSTQPSLFGGTGVASPGSREGPDFLMLRAVSLVLLKSLEYKVQHVTQEGDEGTLDIQSYLGPLMLFLNQHLTRSHQLCHPCVWVSLVFGEQDDDMMEAAKTLMVLYLYQRRVNAASAQDPCGTGCNPHCHFIFLLQSVALTTPCS
ncbi:hypothetical protein MATL_G00139430 [Megalops atlanticus]|uniref:Protein Lines N-terminal domain-containing protein n=1 Tax=Megalops atlanticus TaxID=7932 RepID=A0A9D3PU13_MEGAT|nr:hypothetical protein MATL_G00139430 [Megalops atlanticus]